MMPRSLSTQWCTTLLRWPPSRCDLPLSLSLIILHSNILVVTKILNISSALGCRGFNVCSERILPFLWCPSPSLLSSPPVSKRVDVRPLTPRVLCASCFHFVSRLLLQQQYHMSLTASTVVWAMLRTLFTTGAAKGCAPQVRD